MTSNRGRYPSPRLLIRPSHVLPPVPDCLGNKPSQAANSLPKRNSDASGTLDAIAEATIGPMPGIPASRRGIRAAVLDDPASFTLLLIERARGETQLFVKAVLINGAR